MSTLAQRKMTVDEFLVWAEGREGRWELYNGVPYAMSPERTRHIEVKFAIYLALLQAIRKAGLPCHVVADGAGVRISQHVMHMPDALVYCGPSCRTTPSRCPIRSSWSRWPRPPRASLTTR